MGEEGIGNEFKGNLEDDVRALFKLPLAEFIGARNDLAARLKRAGQANDANLVKALAKPSISAWAVNQLYWEHREPFDRLLAAGQRFRQAQTSHTAGGIADMRESLDARRASISHLSELATILLREAGYNSTPDTMHRITTTLEAVSAYATPSDGPTPGRLTQDVDPPGFESLASLMPGADATTTRNEPTRLTPSQESVSAPAKTRQRESPARDLQNARAAEETRAKMAAAKVALQEAKRSLTEARPRVERLEVARKKAYGEEKQADAELRQAEKQLRDAEERFKKASAASQDAAQRAQRITAEAGEAAQAVEVAERTVQKASRELESLSAR
jgi:DNA repair exonuclease SbcCD ATPase subunit